MRKLAFTAAAMAFAGSAYAADLPLKAPPAPIEPIAPSWTGFYIGGHLGAAWRSNSDMTFSDPNTPVLSALAPLSVSSGDSNTRFLGGVHGGYNWQLDSRWVLGAEADISWTDINANVTVAPVLTNGGLTFVNGSIAMSENVRWLASVRGRVGVVAWPNTLLYATGGVAWENVDYGGTVALVPAFVAPSATAFSRTNTGFVVGGGVEWQAISHVLLRAEYLFYGFNQNQTGSALLGGETVPVNFGWSSSNVQVVRAAVSYKF